MPKTKTTDNSPEIGGVVVYHHPKATKEDRAAFEDQAAIVIAPADENGRVLLFVIPPDGTPFRVRASESKHGGDFSA